MFHSSVWALARAQHGVIARRQLLALGYSEKGIKHRVGIGRLHPLYRGVWVDRPQGLILAYRVLISIAHSAWAIRLGAVVAA